MKPSTETELREALAKLKTFVDALLVGKTLSLMGKVLMEEVDAALTATPEGE